MLVHLGEIFLTYIYSRVLLTREATLKIIFPVTTNSISFLKILHNLGSFLMMVPALLLTYFSIYQFKPSWQVSVLNYFLEPTVYCNVKDPLGALGRDVVGRGRCDRFLPFHSARRGGLTRDSTKPECA